MSTETRLGLLAFAIASALFASVGGIMLLLGSSGASTSSSGALAVVESKHDTSPRPTASPAAKQSASSNDEPYPECPQILKWMNDNTVNPKSVEIIRWENRYPYTKNEGWAKSGDVSVTVKFRADGLVLRRVFHFRNGKYLNSQNWNPAD